LNKIKEKKYHARLSMLNYQENLTWFSRKCFSFILDGKHFPEVIKNLEMSCYLLIISNLILKFFIAIYFVLNFFSISFLRISFNLIFIFILDRNHFSKVVKKFRNIMLFVDYIKFDPQTFDCYIFCYDLFFNFIF
jgi:hypothetical protein